MTYIIINYLQKAVIFHISILFYEWLLGNNLLPLLIMNVGWTSGGLFGFYIYSSNIIVKSFKTLDPDEGSLDRTLYNMTQLYSIYFFGSIVYLLSNIAWLSIFINILMNGIYITQLWLTCHNYCEKPYIDVYISNVGVLSGVCIILELLQLDRISYNLYGLPLLNIIAVYYLEHHPLKLGVPRLVGDVYVRFIWSYILNAS